MQCATYPKSFFAELKKKTPAKALKEFKAIVLDDGAIIPSLLISKYQALFSDSVHSVELDYSALDQAKVMATPKGYGIEAKFTLSVGNCKPDNMPFIAFESIADYIAKAKSVSALNKEQKHIRNLAKIQEKIEHERAVIVDYENKLKEIERVKAMSPNLQRLRRAEAKWYGLLFALKEITLVLGKAQEDRKIAVDLASSLRPRLPESIIALATEAQETPSAHCKKRMRLALKFYDQATQFYQVQMGRYVDLRDYSSVPDSKLGATFARATKPDNNSESWFFIWGQVGRLERAVCYDYTHKSLSALARCVAILNSETQTRVSLTKAKTDLTIAEQNMKILQGGKS